MLGALRKLKHIKALNQLGEVLDNAVNQQTGYPRIVELVREVLSPDVASLWVMDQRSQRLLRETTAARHAHDIESKIMILDEKLGKWQMEKPELIVIRGRSKQVEGVDLPEGFTWNLFSIPLLVQDRLRGVFNLYFRNSKHWLLGAIPESESRELLRAIAGQMVILIHNKQLQFNATFYKEIHHRVKNNLQSVSNLLRLQARRLDSISPERALQESINRIQSISLVHETLCQSDIGLVNLGELIHRVCAMHASGDSAGIKIEESSAERILIDSSAGTSLALVANELVQNSVNHGGGAEGVQVRLRQQGEELILIVSDSGPGLPADFDIEKNSSLGLTIVATLVSEDLHGTLELMNNKGLTVTVRAPLALLVGHTRESA